MQQIAPLEVGLPVVDLDRMVTFYTDALAFEEVRRSDIPPELGGAIRVAAEGYVNVWLKAPGGEVIKLVRPPSPPEQIATAEQSGARTGFAYLTFYCSDLEETLAKALALGAVERSDPWTRSGEVGVKLVFLADPEGNVLELVEPVS